MEHSLGRPLGVRFKERSERRVSRAGQNWKGRGKTGRRGSIPGAGNKCHALKELKAGQVAGWQMQRDPQDEARGRRQAGIMACWAGLSTGYCFGNMDTAWDTPHPLVAQE